MVKDVTKAPKKSHMKDAPSFNKASKKPFKAKKAATNATQPEAVGLQLEDEVPDFPRGGKSFLSQQERAEVHAEVDAEWEAEQRSTMKNKRKKMEKKGNADDDDVGSLFGGGITGKLPKFVNRITLKNICPGMKLWGVVAEVNEKDLVVSLPGGLRGLVRASDACDLILDGEKEDTSFLPDIFFPGRLVSCTVLELDDDKKERGSRKIWLSLRLSLLHKGFTLDAVQEGMALTAYVKSIEDHGYILHFGLPSFTGFLPKNSQVDCVETEMRFGQLVQGVVRSIDKTRKVVYLSSDPDTVSKFVTKDLKGISIDLLIPGMLVNARVQSILENGILLSFLTYFTGTADIFHLQSSFPTKNWKDDYSQNKKVNARILFVDPSTRAVGLTLHADLIHNKAPPFHVTTGEIYEQSKVVRVDRGHGLLLNIPSTPISTPAYVHINDVAEDEVKKLEKKFREGNDVRVRILGFRHLEGLATGVLKASAFEGPVFTHSDVKPGMVVRGKIIEVDRFHAIVKFPSGVKAECPLRHMSEFEVAKPGKKIQVGAELMFRVLGCKSKRITVTYKKTLVKSKLPIISSYADATDGLITHGWIAKIENHGCFVRFYNGVQGFASRYELGLDPGSDPSVAHHVGQVVKCRVTHSAPTSRRINLSFIIKPSRVSEDVTVTPGSLVAGVVDSVTPHAVFIRVSAKGYMKGTISTEHLADHHEQATLLKSLLKPGYEFNQLLVLDIEGRSLVLSAKNSLVNSALELPSDISQILPNSTVHGYVCNLIESGCFIRFLGHLTGFSPRSKATDEVRVELSQSFFVGQSVRSNILNVDKEASRITLSLKQSCCSSTDASFIQDYFLLDEKIAKLQLSNPKGSELKWVEDFTIGSVIEGTIQEAKDFGVAVSFKKYNDIFGFIAHNQLDQNTLEPGSVVQAVILDVSIAECLVDLSLKVDFLGKLKKEKSSSKDKKKRKRETSKDLEVNQTVNAVVEIVKEKYLVLSVPEYNYAIGYACVSDYNTQKLARKQFVNGQSVVANVMALPSHSTKGRLFLLLKSVSEVVETSSSKRAKKKSNYNVGSLVQSEVIEIKPLELRMKFGVGFNGRVHITEVNDSNTTEEPLNNFKIGQTVTARIVSKANNSDHKKACKWELSIKPSLLTASTEGDMPMTKDFKFSIGQCVTGYVYKVDNEWVWITLSRNLHAKLFILDSACEPNELEEFEKRFYVGKAVSGYVIMINKEKKLLRIVKRPLGAIPNITSTDQGSKLEKTDNNDSGELTTHYHEGDILGGRISKILIGTGGLVVRIGPNIYGRVHFTELKDMWVSDPISGYHEGQFVKCKVLEVSRSANGTIHVDLSLRSSLDGMPRIDVLEPKDLDKFSQRAERIEDLRPDMAVKGYVKNVTTKGCFIMLSRKLDAKILLSNLSDGFVEKPEKEFPIGKLVTARVLTVEPLSKRVEVTLKTHDGVNASRSKNSDLSSVQVGDVISGRIKRMEPYGLFITIDHTNLVGLCHVSELSDDHVDNIEGKYRAGEKVTAKILKLNEERHQISLGMRSSYIDNVISNQSDSDEENNEAIAGNGSGKYASILSAPGSDVLALQIMDTECQNGVPPVLLQAESRASIPPLEVTLDDAEHSDVDDIVIRSQEHLEGAEAIDGKTKRREKKKATEQREREINAAEERLLDKDAPRTADEFEKLVRSSPNSSFVWIKYMAFTLSLADIEKARSIAERALRTINIREEDEKLNIWVSYFNLENKYGNPPEEAVTKVFQRALQYCDPRKVHLALLDMYESTEQHKLGDELLDKMIKKFKQSCKVWLRRVQSMLKKNEDGIQSVVNRALLCLPRHKHIKFISQTAIVEFKCGVPDRGRSMFEGILREYPKRTDLWSVYLDQEIRVGDVDMIRALFERAISLSLPPKKMKFLFKKYLGFEQSLHDEERIESVKQKAMDYVKTTLS